MERKEGGEDGEFEQRRKAFDRKKKRLTKSSEHTQLVLGCYGERDLSGHGG